MVWPPAGNGHDCHGNSDFRLSLLCGHSIVHACRCRFGPPDMWAVHCLERIGNHDRNIAEYLIYFVEGNELRHISLEDMEKRISKTS